MGGIAVDLIRRRDVSIWDVVQQKWVEVTGMGTDIAVYVGEHSRDVRAQDVIKASG